VHEYSAKSVEEIAEDQIRLLTLEYSKVAMNMKWSNHS